MKQTISESQREWLNSVEAGQFLGISQPTLRKWTSEGIIPVHQIGSRKFFNRYQLTEALLAV